MARPLDFILDKFPNFNAYSSFNVARELYRRNYGNAQDEFENEEDYNAFLLEEE